MGSTVAPAEPDRQNHLLRRRKNDGASARLHQEDAENAKIRTGRRDQAVESVEVVIMKRKHLGSKFEDFLANEGILEECRATAIKFKIARELEKAMSQRNI